jgi:hypothetical protein
MRVEVLGGVERRRRWARQTVSDNLKAGITRACFHEPMVNRTYADLACHYRTAIVPARPYRPRDKAKVEVGVQIVGRWILARLRNRRFFSLAALNEAIYALLLELNDRPLECRLKLNLVDDLAVDVADQAAAAPARMEALFLSRARGRMYRHDKAAGQR